ncbi:sugar ABC transporter substrate-binding protein (plasmid) [Agrobacterium tumefaciens]|uniref:Sugar ABC transporter substrate-binding protein n=2 Tax=Agrobacterium tumefaciens TaxID=358 RepID=A0AAP9EA24_AGRTU|nr:sugar ABC transporter substrate-binding protein [Agrobacterium tumefaciens]NSZ60091.1 sugar ABC transporter substrate-binding protein [Agrobacterium tumefaciens]QDY97689.2 sugar ABC transporter substrate-binding protein [Agrobacterium tumefaciens]UXS12812.1 sugar ABC transporter substrate-binding protein [Agrobacterium tumefaciens]UXS20174.1 sugar ABC transporter substrate-binding protein [Agrobacterium tumefaciens]UXS27821.1 sugar ABC transporter substrate-binding protein [Agrobacterium tu
MKRLSRRNLMLGAAVVATIAATGMTHAQEGKRIGFMIWNTSVPFYSNLIKTANETAQKQGIKLDIQSGNGDLSAQISVVQQFIAQQVDMIMIAPSDPKGIVPIIRQANAANIPVMAVNTSADISTGAKIVTYVGVDDFVFGQRQGELVIKAVGEKAKIAYILGKLGTSAQLAREAGLMDTLKKYPGIEIVEKQAADWDNSKALAITQDYLSKYQPGSIAAIVDQGPEGVNGANFASENGRTDVKFILGDYPADVRNAIIKGTVYGTVNQDPAPQGSTAIEDAALVFSGKADQVPTPNHYLDLPTITKDNVEQYKAAWGG